MTNARLALAVLVLFGGVLCDALGNAAGWSSQFTAALADDDDDDGGGSDDDDDDGGSRGGGGRGGASSDDDDDGGSGGGGRSGGGGASNDDDDGGSAGGGTNDDDDDDGGAAGRAGSDDDDDDDDNDDDDDDARAGGRSRTDGRPQPAREPAAARSRAGAPLQRLTMPRESADRARGAEISAVNLTEADLGRLQGLGFRVIRSRQVTLFNGTLALRLRTPNQFDAQRALLIARQTAPEGIFDFSHLYSPGQGSPIYARDMVRISAAPGCGRGLRVGMIDTEVAGHPTLRGTRVTRRSFSEGRGDPRHGTAVASLLVGADPSGQAVLDGATLYAASVFSAGGTALDADAIDIVGALDWLAQSGVAVVNISITGPPNALLEAAVDSASRRGLILVAAGGNGTAQGRPRYPAAYPQVIAVAAVDQRLRPYSFNTRGSYIDIAAPGVDVWAANSAGGGALWSGTSFAAPFVSVELAKAFRRGQVRTVTDARRHLAANARDIGAAGRDPVFGAGLLQSAGC